MEIPICISCANGIKKLTKLSVDSINAGIIQFVITNKGFRFNNNLYLISLK